MRIIREVSLRTGIGELIGRMGRVTDADFEVIEPNIEQDGNDESAGDGTEPTSGTVWLTSEADGTIFPVDWRDIPYPF